MKIKSDILAAIDGARIDGDTLTLVDQLERKTYQEVARVIEAAGGKWNRARKAHVFPGSAAEAIEPVLLTGEVTNRKQEFGQFYTPAALAGTVLDTLARKKKAGRMLEPSAGRGAIAAMAHLRGWIVDCVELDQKNVDLLCSISFNGVVHGDFLEQEPRPIYDGVGMNPPFAGQADIRHVMHATKFLRPGGRLVAIMSAGVTFRQNKLTTEFRAFVAERGGTIVPLPEDAFKESGTSVNTVLVSF